MQPVSSRAIRACRLKKESRTDPGSYQPQTWVEQEDWCIAANVGWAMGKKLQAGAKLKVELPKASGLPDMSWLHDRLARHTSIIPSWPAVGILVE